MAFDPRIKDPSFESMGMPTYHPEPFPSVRPSAQVPGPVPVAGNLSSGGIDAVPSSSGLYALYNRRNPDQRTADMFGSMAGRDMGGRLGQLPGVVATVAQGIFQGKANKAEEKRETDVKAFLDRQDTYNKKKMDKEDKRVMLDSAAKVMSMASDKFNQVYQEYGDFNKASQDTALWLTDAAQQYGVPLPMVSGYARFKNGKTVMAVSKDGKDYKTVMLDEKTGNMFMRNEAGNWGEIPDGYLLISDYTKIREAEAAVKRAARISSGANPQGMLEFYDANDNLVAKTKDQAEAIKAGAVKAGRWVKYIDEAGNEGWRQEMVPLSKAAVPKAGNLGNTNPQGQPPAPPAAQRAQTQFGRPAPVPGSPGSGQAPAALAPAATMGHTRAEAIAELEKQGKKISEINIAYVMKLPK